MIFRIFHILVALETYAGITIEEIYFDKNYPENREKLSHERKLQRSFKGEPAELFIEIEEERHRPEKRHENAVSQGFALKLRQVGFFCYIVERNEKRYGKCRRENFIESTEIQVKGITHAAAESKAYLRAETDGGNDKSAYGEKSRKIKATAVIFCDIQTREEQTVADEIGQKVYSVV